MRFATANFQTLAVAHAPDPDLASKKLRLIQEQMWAAGVHVAMGQEARTALGQKQTPGYHCLYGPAPARPAGVLDLG